MAVRFHWVRVVAVRVEESAVCSIEEQRHGQQCGRFGGGT